MKPKGMTLRRPVAAPVQPRMDPERAERRQLYMSPRWRALRARLLRSSPWCTRCEQQGRKSRATVVDHVAGHVDAEGWRERFFSGPFMTLCDVCHNIKTGRVDSQQQRLRRELEQQELRKLRKQAAAGGGDRRGGSVALDTDRAKSRTG
jgi:5-methylcytosine-specific restriction protein A